VVSAFFFAGMLVFLLQLLSSGVLSPEQIENQLGIPAIGLIPRTPKGVAPQDYILQKPGSSYAESLNSLRTSLILSGPDEAVKTIQVTSSVPEEGKSTLAISFARLLAQSGKKVILVDADLRRASVEKKLGIPTRSKGLTDLVMEAETDVSDFVVKDEKSTLLIMPKGGAEYVNASDVFSSHRMKSIVAFLRTNFDYVIFDTPPVMAVSDARILGRLVDKTVFVVHWDKTPKKVVKAAIKQLVTHDVDLAGCVLQQVNLKRYGSYGYGDSGYYYHYGKYGQYYSS
jgi:capsular exopolysaccharide synthesis family protein